jgi:hypothetical protein
MEVKLKILVTIAIGLLILMVSLSGYIVYKYVPIFFADKTWIIDLGYKESEIHKLTFFLVGYRSCPEIPIDVGNSCYRLLFDTGCGKGIFFTNAIEDKINYTFLHKTEALNRDGSHRGWQKSVKVDEINVFGDLYKNIETSISDWSMFASKKFNGAIGLAYFKSKVVTLDYVGHRIAVSSNPIDYTKLDPNKYVILPLYKTTCKRQQDLPFFEAEYNNKPIMVYIDTGTNYSYLHNPECKNSEGNKPTKFLNIPLKIGDMDLMIKEIVEENIAQADGLPYPTMIELNSDQIWKCNLLVTFDLIGQKIIFRKM